MVYTDFFQNVWNIYNPLIASFGDEYTVLIDAAREEMSRIVDPRIAEAIVRAREEKTRVIPGYDGLYGQLELFEEDEEKGKPKIERPKQRSIADFI